MADTLSSAADWYTARKATERAQPASATMAQEACAKRLVEDLKPVVALPKELLEHGLEQLPLDDLRHLAKCAHDALGRVQPLGRKYESPLGRKENESPTPKKASPSLPVVDLTPASSTVSLPALAEQESEPVALNPKKWVDFPLSEREDINHNTRRLRFKLPCTNLGLPVGMHIFLRAKEKIKNPEGEEKLVMRAYTPAGHGPGYVEFVIKVYFANEHPRFPHGGMLTQYMEKMKIGDCLAFKGPLGEFDFDAVAPAVPVPRDTPMTFRVMGNAPVPYRHLGLIAGGSGITPVLQVVNAILELERDITVSILYANQSPDDILCQDMLDNIVKDPRVKVWYTVDRVKEGLEWPYSTGFIDEAMCRDHLPAASEDTYIFMCGPPPMLKFACRPNLDKLGHKESQIHAF